MKISYKRVSIVGLPSERIRSWTKTDGSQVIRKLSRDETRQIEKYKKMGREEKKLYAVKHMNCYHGCVPAILKEKIKRMDCEDCAIECEF